MIDNKKKDDKKNVLSKSITKAARFLTQDTRNFTNAAYKEAQQDNAYFNKLHETKENPETGLLDITLTPEYKKSHEYLQVVFHNLKDKRDNPDTSHTRAALYGMGAGMKIPNGIGEVVTLLETGFTAEVFDSLYGASASALLMACMAMGLKSTLKGAALVCENLATPKFIGVKNMLGGKYINLPFLKKEAEEGDKKFTEEEMSALRAAKVDVNIVVTLPAERGKELETRFLDAKTIPNLMDGVSASMSIDGLTGPIPTIDGISYRDGAFDPLPIEKVIADFTLKHGVPPTDILVLANRPFETQQELALTLSESAKVGSAKAVDVTGETLGRVPNLGSLANLSGPALQAQKYFLGQEALRQSIAYTEKVKKERGINVGIVWSAKNTGLSTTGNNADDMKAGYFESRRKMYDDLGEPQPQDAPWYEPELKEVA